VYFTLQSALPVVIALTSSKGGQLNGFSGLLAPENRFGTLLPLATVAVSGLINQVILRPLTVRTMNERKHQGMLAGPVISSQLLAAKFLQKPVMAKRATTLHHTQRR
jgi:hypothetical protein